MNDIVSIKPTTNGANPKTQFKSQKSGGNGSPFNQSMESSSATDAGIQSKKKDESGLRDSPGSVIKKENAAFSKSKTSESKSGVASADKAVEKKSVEHNQARESEAARISLNDKDFSDALAELQQKVETTDQSEIPALTGNAAREHTVGLTASESQMKGTGAKLIPTVSDVVVRMTDVSEDTAASVSEKAEDVPVGPHGIVAVTPIEQPNKPVSSVAGTVPNDLSKGSGVKGVVQTPSAGHASGQILSDNEAKVPLPTTAGQVSPVVEAAGWKQAEVLLSNKAKGRLENQTLTKKIQKIQDVPGSLALHSVSPSSIAGRGSLNTLSDNSSGFISHGAGDRLGQLSGSEALFPARSSDAEARGRTVLQQSMNNLKFMLTNGQSKAMVHLHPAELGALKIGVEIQNDQMSVHINAAQNVTKEALEFLIPRIRSQLLSEGYSEVEVAVSGGDSLENQASAQYEPNQQDSKSQHSTATNGLRDSAELQTALTSVENYSYQTGGIVGSGRLVDVIA